MTRMDKDLESLFLVEDSTELCDFLGGRGDLEEALRTIYRETFKHFPGVLCGLRINQDYGGSSKYMEVTIPTYLAVDDARMRFNLIEEVWLHQPNHVLESIILRIGFL